MQFEGSPTRILIVDTDEASFEIRQCIAKALAELPPVELFHARDATEALAMLESLDPDVIVIDNDEPGESDLFIESLNGTHPPVVFCTYDQQEVTNEPSLDQQITYIQKCESLEGFHQTLKVAAALGLRFTDSSRGNGVLLH